MPAGYPAGTRYADGTGYGTEQDYQAGQGYGADQGYVPGQRHHEPTQPINVPHRREARRWE